MSIAFFIIIFVVSLFVMITLHELGHFIACKRSGVVVEEFSIGMFGPRLFSRTRGDTTYCFRPVLLGAYVKPIGENDSTVPGGLAAQRPRVRFLVFAAGPVANIILAFFVLSAFLAIEPSFPIRTGEMPWIEGEGVMVQVTPASDGEEKPATEAGIQTGDIITRIGDTEIVKSDDLGDAIQLSDGAPTAIYVQGSEDPLVVEPEYDPADKRWKIGVLTCWGVATAVNDDSPAKGSIE